MKNFSCMNQVGMKVTDQKKNAFFIHLLSIRLCKIFRSKLIKFLEVYKKVYQTEDEGQLRCYLVVWQHLCHSFLYHRTPSNTTFSTSTFIIIFCFTTPSDCVWFSVC